MQQKFHLQWSSSSSRQRRCQPHSTSNKKNGREHMRTNECYTHKENKTNMKTPDTIAFVPGSNHSGVLHTHKYGHFRCERTIFKLNEMSIKTSVHISNCRRHRRHHHVQYEYCRLINANECRWQRDKEIGYHWARARVAMETPNTQTIFSR